MKGRQYKTGRFQALCIAIALSVPVLAQDKDKDKWENPEHTNENFMSFKTGWFVGADAGTSLFYGDVTKYNYFPKFADFKKSFGNGVSIHGGKKFKYGLAAEVQVSKGTLKGEKIADKLYPRYFNADYMDYSVGLKFNLSQQIFRGAVPRKFFNRLSVFATVAGGQTFFRSRLYKQANNGLWYLEHVNGYSSSGIDSAGIGRAGGLVTNKTTMASAIILPVGTKINYKLNGKTDITFDLRYVTVFSDKLDSWERSWTHYDRYMYMGIGLTYNIGKTDSDDMPDSQRYLPHEKKEEVSANPDDSQGKVPSRGGLFKRKSKSDKDTEIRLKMYELMLMMFEMNYMK